MYPAKDARELAILLRISRELDVVGDVTATVDSPSELLAWGLTLSKPDVVAWRPEDSGHRYLQVIAQRHRPPIRGTAAAVLDCEQHREFWNALGLEHLPPGHRHHLTVAALSAAWDVMPITPASTAETRAAPNVTSESEPESGDISRAEDAS